jgi:hypothetical protein
MLHSIPFELQQLDQWVVATGAVDPQSPASATKSRSIRAQERKGRPHRPARHGAPSAEAQACGYPLVGFVLSKEDPYCIIDLDDPRVDSDGQPFPDDIVAKYVQSHERILEGFQSYSEMSQSGNGVHIVCRGSIPHGVRRGKVEIYSDLRYMICTGNIFRPLPIIDCQDQLMALYHAMNAEQPTTALVQVDGHMGDEEVFNMASNAANAAKFMLLWGGNWRNTGEWQSQSEADFALLSMLAFYTKDNAQVRRLFRWSGMVRPKSQEGVDGYLNIALSKIRAKEAPPIDFSQLLIKHTQTTLPLHETQSHTPQHSTERSVEPSGSTDSGGVGSADSPESGTDKRIAVHAAHQEEVPFPPGFIGEVAEYFYSSAIRPVREVALAAALALTAGVAGRTYNVSGSGLNQYLIVIARTGSGKEGAQKGIDKLVAAVRAQIPMADNFIGPGQFASGQGLLRSLGRNPCFVSVLGEIGLQLKAICDKNSSPSQTMLKKVLLDIYAKSGHDSILYPSAYSDTEKDTKLVQAPNVTIFGESTEENFYDALDASNIAEGLVPRFSIFEYFGPRPKRNQNAFRPPSKELVSKFAEILAIAIAANQNRAHCPVQVSAEAQAAFDHFDEQADAEMNGALFDVNRQLWNRAHLKALKLGALIAVGCNPNQPLISLEHAEWAIQVVGRDIKRLLKRFAAGDIGQGDERMEADLRRATEDVCRMSRKEKQQYQITDKLLDHPVVPLYYYKRRLRALAAFRNHRLGANAALDLTLKSMVNAGELQLVPPIQSASMFGTTIPLYVKGPNW